MAFLYSLLGLGERIPGFDHVGRRRSDQADTRLLCRTRKAVCCPATEHRTVALAAQRRGAGAGRRRGSAGPGSAGPHGCNDVVTAHPDTFGVDAR